MPPRGRGSKINVSGTGKSPGRVTKSPGRVTKSPASRATKSPAVRVSKAIVSKAKKKTLGSHKLPPPLPTGSILTDVKKKSWRIGSGIGQGGFGLIYSASDDIDHAVGSDAEYVVKVEPVANGPLFCETHFYQRVAKSEEIDAFVKSKKFKYLGVPKFISAGQHSHNGVAYRFLVMRRFGTDLQKIFEGCGKKFSRKSVACVGLRMLDALEYMHNHEYVHADIKASNILLGYRNGAVDNNQVYLVDFGLAYRYDVEGKHKEYKEDPRRAHDGTIEFTSRDAHNGVFPARRGDLEILGYCLLQWLCGQLPWEKNLNNKEYVKSSKLEYMGNIESLMKACFPSNDTPAEIRDYLKYVSKLKYEEKPDYDYLRKVLRSTFPAGRKSTEWTLELNETASTSQTPTAKRAPKHKISDDNIQSVIVKKKKDVPVVEETMTPAMKAQMAKIKNGSSSSGKRVVKRNKAVKCDMAVQTSPALARKRKTPSPRKRKTAI